MVTVAGVWKGMESVPFIAPASAPVGVAAHGPGEFVQPRGGPLLIAGHGGR